ncbi:MAG: DUF4292 domain-containing protein [Muribaculum sp.]|nr:DUF4292 domain-containing protein [Muribaculum sp.]
MKRALLTILTAISFICGLSAQTPLDKAASEKLLEQVIADYSDWGRVELNGTVGSPALPISASLKIYMEKGKRTMISVRAPFAGEVARVEFSNDSVLIVNRLKRKYCRASTDVLQQIYPGVQTDLQSILLGRVTLMGRGQLRAVNFDKISVSKADDGSYILIPDSSLQPSGASYGYVVASDGTPDNMVVLAPDYNVAVEVDYDFHGSKTGDKSYGLKLIADVNDKSMEAELEFYAPRWGAQPMAPFVITDRYNETTLRGVF